MMYADAVVSPPKNLNLSEKIQYASEVASLLSFLHGFSADRIECKKYVESACMTIKFVTEREDDSEKVNKLTFVLEQLELLYKSPTGRRYSNITLAICMTWYKTSSALYDVIISDSVMTIPSPDHLKRLSSAFNDDMSFSNSMIAYLKARFSVLNDRDKNVIVLMDEVKTNQAVEYVGGNFPGKNEDGVTKGLLSVMLSSLAGKYRDNVAMIPVVTLKSTTMDTVYDKVLKGVTEIGFSTCANSVDAHRTNKKFYKTLCGGTITESIPNPYKTSDSIFNLFDTPHIFKCIYNIFLTRKLFLCPAFNEFSEMRPDFDHIKKLHEIEFGKSPKIAYKLSDKNLASKPIERRAMFVWRTQYFTKVRSMPLMLIQRNTPNSR